MLSQPLPNACNSNLKGSLRPGLSFHWSFLSLHSKFMCRVELQGSFKPLKWFAEQPVDLEWGRCLKGLWTSWYLWMALAAESGLHSWLSVLIVVCRLPPGSPFMSSPSLIKPVVSNPGSTSLLKSKCTPFRKVCSVYFNFKWHTGDHNEISYSLVARKYLWSVILSVITDKGRNHYLIFMD